MAISVANFVREGSSTGGTGTYDLTGATGRFQTFIDGVGDGATVYYHAFDDQDFESGIGTITQGSPDTLSRDTILESSNSNAAVDWPASGRRTIVMTAPAQKTVLEDENDDASVGRDFSVGRNLDVTGDENVTGSFVAGSPTGGSQGDGSVNAESVHVDGEAVPAKSVNETISGDWIFAGSTGVESGAIHLAPERFVSAEVGSNVGRILGVDENGTLVIGDLDGTLSTIIRFVSSDNIDRMDINTDGAIVVGSPIGGYQETGSLNAENLYIFGNQVVHRGDRYVSWEISITDGDRTRAAHGLGDYPFQAGAYLVCKSSEHGYNVGDRIPISFQKFEVGNSTFGEGVLVTYNDSVVISTVGDNGISILNQNDGDNRDITNSSWRIVLWAIL